MPRQPRLDAPGVLHHVMVRGIERTSIFRDDTDRTDFVARVAALAAAGGWTLYAWALLPNHAHLLLRTGSRPLPRSMRALLTGYAGAFNRRHHRVGHLFQNRYKSIVVEAEPYGVELVRYLHLNPLRAQVLPDLRALDRYPWTGHSALLGTVPRAWQDTASILTQFGPTGPRARRAYHAFVAAGIAQGRRPELEGGGLLRSLGGWQAVAALRRGREAYRGDERVLGSSEFVADLQRTLAPAPLGPLGRLPLETLVARVCRHVGVAPAALVGGAAGPPSSAPGRASPTSGSPCSAGRAGLSPPLSACSPPPCSRLPSAAPARGPAGRRSWGRNDRRVRMQRPLSTLDPLPATPNPGEPLQRRSPQRDSFEPPVKPRPASAARVVQKLGGGKVQFRLDFLSRR